MSEGTPVTTGTITKDGVLALLREVEGLRTTGVLRFHDGRRRGEVRLVRGEIATEQPPLEHGEDPVEVLLELGEAEYELVQQLPPLPVAQGDAQHRRGSLQVHVPADLMNYCEQAGLTGTLRFEREGRTASAFYDRGELVGIKVDGREDADLHKVFGWEEGTFEIEARALAPDLDLELELDIEVEDEEPLDRDPTIPRPARRRDETGQRFLNVVEVTLSRVMHERESYRPPSRSSPPLPAMPQARMPREAQAAGAPPERRVSREEREPTVKIVYHSRRTDPGTAPIVGSARESEGRPMAEDNQRPDGGEERAEAGSPESAPAESEGAASPPGGAAEAPADGSGGGGFGSPERGRTTLLGTAAWIAVILGLMLLTVRLLALLPPME